MFGYGPMFGYNGGGSFKVTYKCYSVSMLPGQERHDVDRGGKIIMPPSALDQLTRLNIQYPMLFKLTNERTTRETHCGVLEFVADEGIIYLPHWMMSNLLLEEGGLVQLESMSLPIASFTKFQPQSPDFLDITNPKAVLENGLRSFACLTTGDIVAIKYNDKVYELCVLETKPAKAVSIIECDMNVDFAPPLGYKEPDYSRQPARSDSKEEDMQIDVPEQIDERFRAFSGSGNRLDGKKKGTEATEGTGPTMERERGIPNYEYKQNKITFIRRARQQQNGEDKDDDASFTAFQGSGQILRKKGNSRK